MFRASRPLLPAEGTCGKQTVAWFLAGLLVVAPAVAAVDAHNILAVYSNSRLLPSNVEGDRGPREAVCLPRPASVLLFDEVLDSPRCGGEVRERGFYDAANEEASSTVRGALE